MVADNRGGMDGDTATITVANRRRSRMPAPTSRATRGPPSR
jgi:hypothetical protein